TAARLPQSRLRGGEADSTNKSQRMTFRFPPFRSRQVIALTERDDLPADRAHRLLAAAFSTVSSMRNPATATERRLKRAFDAEQAARGACADQAPRLKAAAQRIGREREPLHARDAQHGNEAMKAVAVAGGDERRGGLVGVVRVAARIGIAILEDVGRGA